MASAESWRVFCVVELPEAVRLRVLQHIARLREALPDAKASWSRDSSLHLTLKFIGEIPQSKVASFSQAVERSVEGFTVFTIRLEHTGVFPANGQPRVLWLGIDDPKGNLAALHSRLEEESAQAGFPKEERSFHPHLTLARLRQPLHARTLAAVHKEMQFEPAEITVSELLVIRSELGREGPKYTTISRHPLAVGNETTGRVLK